MLSHKLHVSPINTSRDRKRYPRDHGKALDRSAEDSAQAIGCYFFLSPLVIHSTMRCVGMTATTIAITTTNRTSNRKTRAISLMFA
jgi:hypothetical protein